MLGVKVIVFAELAIEIDGASLQQCRARAVISVENSPAAHAKVAWSRS